MARRIAGAILLSLTVFLLSCGENGTTVVTPAGILVISGDGQIGTVGQALSSQITFQVVDDNDEGISGVDVTFSTDDGSVSPASGTTDSDGQVTTSWTLGTTAGAQEATAATEGLSETASATAEPGPAETLAVTPASPETLTALDETAQLSANAEDEFGNAVTDVTWMSTDDAVASVNASGLVTAVANGSAMIAATSGSLSDTVDVTVQQEAADVTVTGDMDRLAWSEMVQLNGDAVDANGNPVAGASLTWESADSGIATVDGTGLVTGEGLGTVDILATVDTLTGTFAVTITTVPGATFSTGEDSACLLDETGQAYCWGANFDGQVGDGTNDYINTPVAVSGGHTFVSLGDADGRHHCALNEAGEAYCWGDNSFDQLGDGSGSDSNVPVAVSGGMAFQSVHPGYRHTCALDPDGNAYCWGDNADGQVGDGTTTDRTAPTAVATGLTFDMLSAGGVTNCALDGTQAYCWGYNAEGQAGDGTTASPRTTPGTVAGGYAFAKVTAGLLHTCAMTTAGEPYCWGLNPSGELGDGTTDNASSPTPVSDLATVDDIAAGQEATCAIVSGTGYCWGNNDIGGLGDGSLFPRSTPATVTGGISWSRILASSTNSCGISTDGTPYCWGYTLLAGDGSSDSEPTPVMVAGGQTFANISAGDGFTCAATGTPDTFCWGLNTEGQLGIGEDSTLFEPTQAQIADVDLEEVHSGGSFACGLASGGTAYCWGDNDQGQLGTGTNDSSYVPVEVDAAFTFSAIAVGTDHACGIRASNGDAYCWGDNNYGQLGDGTTTDRTSPTAVTGGHTFAAIAGGARHTCGLASTGTTYCWGDNFEGQIGDGTNTDRTSPTTVAGGLGFVDVTTGDLHSCGWTLGNLAYCWGANGNGQLGDGTTTDRNEPVAVSGGVSFDMVDGGGQHTCGVGTGGTAYCWGDGVQGQIGNGSTANQSAPTPIQGGLNMATVSAGMEHSCAITTGGVSYCWGEVGLGALGDGSSLVIQPTPVAGSHTVLVDAFAPAGSGLTWGGEQVGQPVQLSPQELQALRDRIQELGETEARPMGSLLQEREGPIRR